MQLELRKKTYFDECATREMAQYLHAPKRTVRETLVYAARILAGPEAGLAGQLSARSERPKANWMSRSDWGFDEATPDDFIEVGADLNSITGGGMAILQHASICASTKCVRISAIAAVPYRLPYLGHARRRCSRMGSRPRSAPGTTCWRSAPAANRG